MKQYFKILIIFFMFLICSNKSFAGHLSSMISSSPLDKTSTIAVSVKDAETGKTVYEYNEKKLLHPASTLKVFTTIPAIDTLDKNFSFNTGFYVCGNDLYIKLSGDPFLTSADLKNAVKDIKTAGYKNFRNVYVDSSVMDNLESGVGWMWDDGTSTSVRKFSAYNLDNNLLNIGVINENGQITADTKSIYPVPVINNVKAGNENSVIAVRHDWISPDIICLKGTVKDKISVQVPINNMQKYFNYRLSATLRKVNVKVANDVILKGVVPSEAKKITEISHPLELVLSPIFKDSSNKDCETVVKVAGGVSENSTGTLVNSLNMFYDYWNSKSIDTSDLIIADASGISRNNLVTADFMTNALNYLYEAKGFEELSGLLAQPGEGTLSNRLLNLRGSIWLKTGTLENISGITGYVKTDSGKIYSVAILIQNFNYPVKQVKEFENEIITLIQKL